MRVTKPPSRPIPRCAGHSSPAHAERQLWSLAYSHILMKACMQIRTTFSFWLFSFLYNFTLTGGEWRAVAVMAIRATGLNMWRCDLNSGKL